MSQGQRCGDEAAEGEKRTRAEGAEGAEGVAK